MPRFLSPELELDVLVVGAGHAGTEAAVAAARIGARVGLITSALETIGQMSCNPAIGGVAKGTVAREVDALGGVMGRATDLAMIQFRMLNRSKGPAVWAPRAQCDRGLYRRAVRSLVETHERLTTIQGTVARLAIDETEGRVTGLETLEGRRFSAKAVVITTGTFLRGRIHIGTSTAIAGGRAGDPPATHLAEQLERLGLTVSRFKTGTPPRIDGRSVDYSGLQRQDSELDDFGFRWSHFWTNAERALPRGHPRREEFDDVVRATSPVQQNSSFLGCPLGARSSLHPRQLPCWITHAGPEVKRIIRDNLERSAMYGGAIGARGPRYCPSVEDKIVKFPDVERHQVFLEPEGHDTHELYVNGLSTSLPPDVQLAFLRAVPGLANVRMTRAGYAIEYDYFPPIQLDASLQVKALRGLFFAGQINGTTGYEEAAGQGVVGGINAGLFAAQRPPLILGRQTSYIGVLVDDLVTRGVDEPYRLFTSRSEFRLTVRQDNALRRLGPTAIALGMLTEEESRIVEQRLTAEDHAHGLAQQTSVRPEVVNELLASTGSTSIQQPMKLIELAKRQHVSLRTLFDAAGVGRDVPDDVAITADLEIKYEGYFTRERDQAERLRRMGDFALAVDLAYEEMRSLSFEARQKLSAIRPLTLAQASRIPGVSPSDLQNLVLEVGKRRRLAPR
jgi:tRNA uridine 5-carboxymethylaminomethyl modification enzyme